MADCGQLPPFPVAALEIPKAALSSEFDFGRYGVVCGLSGLEGRRQNRRSQVRVDAKISLAFPQLNPFMNPSTYAAALAPKSMA